MRLQAVDLTLLIVYWQQTGFFHPRPLRKYIQESGLAASSDARQEYDERSVGLQCLEKKIDFLGTTDEIALKAVIEQVLYLQHPMATSAPRATTTDL
jgi:hypothetical protein